MFTCPNDRAELTRTPGPFGISWTCPRCGGRAVGIGVMRKAVTADAVTRLWTSARSANGHRGKACPSCLDQMVEVPAGTADTAPTIDVCRKCYFLWFDPAEFESLPARPTPPREPELPEEAREIMATTMAQEIADQYRPANAGAAPPDELWKYIPAALGMPVEVETSVFVRLPWMTWAIVALISGVSIAAFSNLQAAVARYGLIPAEAGRLGGLTFLTSFFLHGGVVHLVSNMYFLLIFGDNVEDALGKVRYVILLLAAAFAGALLHVAFDPRSDVPVIGASGGISGVILYYALKYPRAQLGVLTRMFFYVRWVRMPAYGYFGFWVLFQVIGAFQQVAGLTNVSALAHLGGAATGLAAWLVMLRD